MISMSSPQSRWDAEIFTKEFSAPLRLRGEDIEKVCG
jgi:hypothetical protein